MLQDKEGGMAHISRDHREHHPLGWPDHKTHGYVVLSAASQEQVRVLQEASRRPVRPNLQVRSDARLLHEIRSARSKAHCSGGQVGIRSKALAVAVESVTISAQSKSEDAGTLLNKATIRKSRIT